MKTVSALQSCFANYQIYLCVFNIEDQGAGGVRTRTEFSEPERRGFNPHSGICFLFQRGNSCSFYLPTCLLSANIQPPAAVLKLLNVYK